MPDMRREEDDLEVKSIEKKEKSIVEFIVEVNSEEFGAAMGTAVRKIKGKVSVPGFRKGKAPRAMIERMYGASIFHNDALDILLPDVFTFLVEQPNVKMIDVPKVTDIDIKEGDGGADITLEAPFWPEVAVGEYKGISAPKRIVEVSDIEIEQEIESIRLRNARYETVGRPAASGDITVIDYMGFIDGEKFEGGAANGHELELGSGAFIPGFEEKLEGMSAGDSRDIDLVFPENYAEQLAGKPVVFKVNMVEVRERQLPELDDEFAKDVSEFDTFGEFRADIKSKQEARRQTAADDAFEDALMDKIVDNIEIDLPDFMIEQQMDIQMRNFARQVQSYGMEPASYLKMMNTTPDVFRERMRGQSEKQVKIMLALQKIAELEGVEVSEEEIDSEYAGIVAQTGRDLEEIKKSADEDRITTDIKMRKAARVIIDSAVAKEPASEDFDSGENGGEGGENDGGAGQKKASDKSAAKKQPASRKKKPAGPDDESEGQ